MSNLRMYKYPLFNTWYPDYLDDAISIKAPPSLGLQHVGMQNGVVMLWAMIDNDAAPIKRTFRIAATGQLLLENLAYLGTVFDRIFVWHIFEQPEAK